MMKDKKPYPIPEPSDGELINKSSYKIECPNMKDKILELKKVAEKLADKYSIGTDADDRWLLKLQEAIDELRDQVEAQELVQKNIEKLGW